MTPSCPWCGKRSTVETLPRAIRGKDFFCVACDLVLSGSDEEHRASTGQRAIARQIRDLNAHRTTP